MTDHETHEKAITRVAQWLDLPPEDEQEFIDLAHQVARTTEGHYTRYDEKYLQHLEGKVFTHEKILSYLERSGVGREFVEKFETETIPFEEVYQSWNEVKYSTNEILDLTMRLKLIDASSKQTELGLVGSRYKLQKLAYLVNRNLARQDRLDADTIPYDHGKLEKTGFRYTYRKRKSGPYSRGLDEDRQRLYASNLIDETLVSDTSTPEINEEKGRFEISLGMAGRVVMERFSAILEGMETDVLSEWETAIDTVVAEYGAMSIDQLQTRIENIDDVQAADDRDLLLRGRQVEYESGPWLEISGEGVSYV